jgi:hypothetical protein
MRQRKEDKGINKKHTIYKSAREEERMKEK